MPKANKFPSLDPNSVISLLDGCTSYVQSPSLITENLVDRPFFLLLLSTIHRVIADYRKGLIPGQVDFGWLECPPINQKVVALIPS